MKIIAYTALLYGKDYLGSAIRSVIDYIDEYYVLYTSIGSHGHRTDLPCPDTRQELLEIAIQSAGRKLRWFDGEWSYEGQQRDTIFSLAPDADAILVLDADEIWKESIITNAIDFKNGVPFHRNVHRVRVPMVHFWRSFNKAILHDPAYPERIIFPKANTRDVITQGTQYGYIAHMGYAQRKDIVFYKQHTHGHKNEWRKDCDWYNDRFMNREATTDLHPVGSDSWTYELIDPMNYLPNYMQQHPFWGKEWIE